MGAKGRYLWMGIPDIGHSYLGEHRRRGRLCGRRGIAAGRRQRRRPRLSRNHRGRVSPADGVRRANWSIEGVAGISITEHKSSQTGNGKDVGVRRSVGIARLSNRTPVTGQARQFAEKARLAPNFGAISEAEGDMTHA